MRLSYFFLAFAFFLSSHLSAQSVEAPTWEEFGRQYLSYNGSPVTFSPEDQRRHAGRLRCVKMNNYGCVMGATWQGGIGNDSAGHRIFEHPRWSVRAVVRDYCSKSKRQLKTALQIAEAYSPWCDTLGTVKVRNGWGRTCNDNLPRVDAGFAGPRCEKPANGTPAPGQCRSCNCPSDVAKGMAASLGLAITDDLRLFQGDGAPDEARLVKVLRSKFLRETGFTVSDTLLQDGIQLAGMCR